MSMTDRMPMRGGSIRSIIAQARYETQEEGSSRPSLRNAPRPFTPAETTRRFSGTDSFGDRSGGRPPSTPQVHHTSFGAEPSSGAAAGGTTGPEVWTLDDTMTPRGATPRSVGSTGSISGGAGAGAGAGMRDKEKVSRSERKDKKEEKGSRGDRTSDRERRPPSASSSTGGSGSASLQAPLPQLSGTAMRPPVSGGSTRPSATPDDGFMTVSTHLNAISPTAPPVEAKKACDALIKWIDNRPKGTDRSGLSSTTRTAIVKAASKCMETSDNRLQAKLVALLLRVVKGGGNLLATSKFAFRLSKSRENDACLLEEGVLVQIGTRLRGRARSGLSDDKDANDLEACLYLVGVVKNATEAMATLVSKQEGLETEQLVLESEGVRGVPTALVAMVDVVAPLVARGGGGDTAHTLLVQTVVAMRNLTVSDDLRAAVLKAGGLRAVCDVVVIVATSAELAFAATRVFSSFASYQDSFAAVLAEPFVVPSLITAVRAHGGHAPTVARAAYVLGNMCECSKEHRDAVAVKHDGLSCVLEAFAAHVATFTSVDDDDDDDDCNDNAAGTGNADNGEGCEGRVARHGGTAVIDACVSLTRLVANLCVDLDTACTVSKTTCIDGLLSIITQFQKLCDNSDECGLGCEELALNALSCITNLSFGAGSGGDGSIAGADYVWGRRTVLCRSLAPLLFHANVEVCSESFRVLANLARDSEVIDVLLQLKVEQALILLLQHNDRNVAASASGLAINICGCDAGREALVESDIVDSMTNLCKTAWTSDLYITCNCVKALANYGAAFTHDKNARAIDVDDGLTIRSTLYSLRDALADAPSEEMEQYGADIERSIVDALTAVDAVCGVDDGTGCHLEPL